MKTQVTIEAQVWVNKGFADGNVHWSPKLGHTFKIMLQGEAFRYLEPEGQAEVCKRMLADESNQATKYEYIEHSATSSPDTVLDGVKMSGYINEQFNAVKA